MTDVKLSKFQGYTIQRVARSQIIDAHYNPRRIKPGNKERLAKGLTKYKLVETPVWNKRTGNLVSGHQRLSILDEKHKRADYSLDVAAIDVDEKTEVELNILLNNESAMGDFDIAAIEGLRLEWGIDLEQVGFSTEDMYLDFGMDKPVAPEKSPEAKAAITEKRNEEKRDYAEAKATGLANDSEAKQDYTIQIVFQTNAAAAAFLESRGLSAKMRVFPAEMIFGEA